MTAQHKRIVGDTRSLFAVTLMREGAAVNLTGLFVRFSMVDADGQVKVAETAGNVSVSNAAAGEVEYDFQAADVDQPGTFYAYFHVYGTDPDVDPNAERDTYPSKEGVPVLITATTEDRNSPESIDVVGMANAPKKVRTEEGSVEERSVSELIEADRYQQSKTSADKPPWGARIARTKPGGTVVLLLLSLSLSVLTAQ